MIRAAIVLALLGLIGFGAWKMAPAVTQAKSMEVPATSVKRGDVEFMITARGELQGGNTQMLSVPMTGGQPAAITMLRQNGEMVKEGDAVVQFDTTEQEFKLREAEADLAEAEQQIVQAKAEADAKEEETRYAVLQAQANVQLADIEMQRNEILPRLLVRQNEMALAAAKDQLQKIEKDLTNRMATARSGIAIQEAAQAKAKVKADTARKNIEAMTLKAKAPGYAAIQQNDEGNLRWGMYLPPYQVGDIARPGKAVAQIPDLSNWEATARIGELDRGHIGVGQHAELSVVAAPGKKLLGKIKTIGGTAGPPWDRHFDCRVAIENPVAELRPGMSVELRITTGLAKGVTWIPAQALFEAEGRKYVYVKTPDGYRPKDIEMVQRSESQVVIKGLNEGQLVAMANPEESQKKAAGGGAMSALGKK
ncbi:MAG: efflux RND transporter periplasmic adaptor subunit [Acidobacteriota bacterium]